MLTTTERRTAVRTALQSTAEWATLSPEARAQHLLEGNRLVKSGVSLANLPEVFGLTATEPRTVTLAEAYSAATAPACTEPPAPMTTPAPTEPASVSAGRMWAALEQDRVAPTTKPVAPTASKETATVTTQTALPVGSAALFGKKARPVTVVRHNADGTATVRYTGPTDGDWLTGQEYYARSASLKPVPAVVVQAAPAVVVQPTAPVVQPVAAPVAKPVTPVVQDARPAPSSIPAAGRLKSMGLYLLVDLCKQHGLPYAEDTDAKAAMIAALEARRRVGSVVGVGDLPAKPAAPVVSPVVAAQPATVVAPAPAQPAAPKAPTAQCAATRSTSGTNPAGTRCSFAALPGQPLCAIHARQAARLADQPAPAVATSEPAVVSPPALSAAPAAEPRTINHLDGTGCCDGCKRRAVVLGPAGRCEPCTARLDLVPALDADRPVAPAVGVEGSGRRVGDAVQSARAGYSGTSLPRPNGRVPFAVRAEPTDAPKAASSGPAAKPAAVPLSDQQRLQLAETLVALEAAQAANATLEGRLALLEARQASMEQQLLDQSAALEALLEEVATARSVRQPDAPAVVKAPAPVVQPAVARHEPAALPGTVVVTNPTFGTPEVITAEEAARREVAHAMGRYGLCNGTNRSGEPCRQKARHGGYCRSHGPR